MKCPARVRILYQVVFALAQSEIEYAFTTRVIYLSTYSGTVRSHFTAGGHDTIIAYSTNETHASNMVNSIGLALKTFLCIDDGHIHALPRSRIIIYKSLDPTKTTVVYNPVCTSDSKISLSQSNTTSKTFYFYAKMLSHSSRQ